jgi:acyl-CoA reductase-like NAD-dependent aldehyde dehydrogenase
MIAEAIREHTEELIELDILDHGTPRFGAAWTVSWAIRNFEWAASASKAMSGDLLQQVDPGRKIILQREPIGVSALITPWNVPLVALSAKLGASMTVGNTCIVKPPSIDALSSMRLAEILDKLDIPLGERKSSALWHALWNPLPPRMK